jgi:hypothetical protein
MYVTIDGRMRCAMPAPGEKPTPFAAASHDDDERTRTEATE